MDIDMNHFSFEATKHNVVKILRGLKLGKPILLEGPPGVGKTSTVESIARAIGKKIIRINLSEHTDMMDLLGSEYPIPVSSGTDDHDDITFQWCDGALLTAIKHGYWFLLDEMNLAHQSVLEGLNAILDHRKTVYIPELDQEFKCHPDFHMFACQNPIEHGIGRKSLPKSFLNRFIKIFLEDLTDDNYFNILKSRYGGFCTDEEIKNLLQMTQELQKVTSSASSSLASSTESQFNLRDLFRFFDLLTSSRFPNLSSTAKLQQAFSITTAKLASPDAVASARRLFMKYTGLPLPEPQPLVVKSSAASLSFHLPNFDDSALLTVDKVGTGCNTAKGPFHIQSAPYSNYLHMLTVVEWPVLLVSKAHRGKTHLVHTLAMLLDAKCVNIRLCESTDTTDILGSYQQITHNHKAQFVWTDSVLVKAVEQGHWVVIENFNHTGGSAGVVLDRLNSLLEEDGELVVNEAGLIDGELRRVRKHPKFRIFFLINEETMAYSAISKPLRNRC